MSATSVFASDAVALRAAADVARAEGKTPTCLKLAIAAVALNLLISSNLLYICGINYGSPGGNPLVKFHPGTYLMFIAFAAMLWEERRPLHTFSEVFRTGGRPVFYIAMMGVCLILGLFANGISGTAVYIESYVPAGLFVLIFERRANAAVTRRMAYLLLSLFSLNVAICLIETVLRQRLIPIYLVDQLFVEPDSEFRGTGLYEHPLTGAAMTMIGLMLLFGMKLRPWPRGLLAALLMMGLIAFGGRTALATTVVTFLLWGGAVMFQRGARDQLRPRDIGLALLTLIAVPVFIAIIFTQTSLGQRILAHLYWDESANVRIIQWQVLRSMNLSELLFGASFERLQDMVFQIGLLVPFDDIENFWLLMFINLGAIGFFVFMTGFLVFLYHLWKELPPAGRILLVTMLAVASTSNSLGRKSNLLTVAVPAALATTAFYRREEHEAGAADAQPTATGKLFGHRRQRGTALAPPSIAVPRPATVFSGGGAHASNPVFSDLRHDADGGSTRL